MLTAKRANVQHRTMRGGRNRSITSCLDNSYTKVYDSPHCAYQPTYLGTLRETCESRDVCVWPWQRQVHMLRSLLCFNQAAPTVHTSYMLVAQRCNEPLLARRPAFSILRSCTLVITCGGSAATAFGVRQTCSNSAWLSVSL